MLERKGFEVENSTDFISEGIVEGAKIFLLLLKNKLKMGSCLSFLLES